MKQRDLIRIRLQWHDAREQELVAGGMDRIAASETAYHEVVRMKKKDLLAWDRQQKEKAQQQQQQEYGYVPDSEDGYHRCDV